LSSSFKRDAFAFSSAFRSSYKSKHTILNTHKPKVTQSMCKNVLRDDINEDKMDFYCDDIPLSFHKLNFAHLLLPALFFLLLPCFPFLLFRQFLLRQIRLSGTLPLLARAHSSEEQQEYDDENEEDEVAQLRVASAGIEISSEATNGENDFMFPAFLRRTCKAASAFNASFSRAASAAAAALAAAATLAAAAALAFADSFPSPFLPLLLPIEEGPVLLLLFFPFLGMPAPPEGGCGDRLRLDVWLLLELEEEGRRDKKRYLLKTCRHTRTKRLVYVNRPPLNRCSD